MAPRIEIHGKVVTINGTRARKIWTGGDRDCYVARDIIVKKLGRYSWMDQSAREWHIWQRIEKRDRKYFAAPIAHGRGWIAQRVVKFKRGRRPRAAWELAERLARKYGILNDCFETDGSFDLWVNWGVREDGRVVIFDWGF